MSVVGILSSPELFFFLVLNLIFLCVSLYLNCCFVLLVVYVYALADKRNNLGFTDAIVRLEDLLSLWQYKPFASAPLQPHWLLDNRSGSVRIHLTKAEVVFFSFFFAFPPHFFFFLIIQPNSDEVTLLSECYRRPSLPLRCCYTSLWSCFCHVHAENVFTDIPAVLWRVKRRSVGASRDAFSSAILSFSLFHSFPSH